jgi:hypothetical protein
MSDQQELLSSKLKTIKKVRILRRRNDRMKLSFNLTKEEAEAFNNFYTAVNIHGNTEEEFVKTAFILGLKKMEQTIYEQMQKELLKQQEQTETSESVEIVEDETEETEE